LRGFGIVPEGGVFDPIVQVGETLDGGIPVKDASLAGRSTAGFGCGERRIRWTCHPTEREKGSASFLKKRSKKLLSIGAK
jgi:hypothetical protein